VTRLGFGPVGPDSPRWVRTGPPRQPHGAPGGAHPGAPSRCPQQVLSLPPTGPVDCPFYIHQRGASQKVGPATSSFRQTPGHARHRPARYTQRALDHVHATGRAVRDEDIDRLSPLAHDHITLTRRCRIALPAPLRDQAAYRPLQAAPPAAAAASGCAGQDPVRPSQRVEGLKRHVASCSTAVGRNRLETDRFQDTTRETVKAAQSTSWSVSEASLTLGVGSKVRVRDF
jgi:hypothetical protein